MNIALIKIDSSRLNGEAVQTCQARDLWQFLDIKRKFGDWIKGRIGQYGFVEGQDFTVHKFVNGRATVIDYHLTLDTAKELAMVENNAKGREVRRYFIACERQALGEYIKPVLQHEKYWFAKYPHWQAILPLALQGMRCKVIGEKLNLSAGRVGRAIRRMVQVGLLDPAKRLAARFKPATAQRLMQLPLFSSWGEPA